MMLLSALSSLSLLLMEGCTAFSSAHVLHHCHLHYQKRQAQQRIKVSTTTTTTRVYNQNDDDDDDDGRQDDDVDGGAPPLSRDHHHGDWLEFGKEWVTFQKE